MTLPPIPAVSHVDVSAEGAQVVATEQLPPAQALHLRNAARAAGGAGTRARVMPPEENLPTRVLVWRTDMRSSQLANRLITGLDARLSVNVVSHLSTLAAPERAGAWITGVGIAVLTPLTAARLDQLVEQFRSGFELLGLEVTVAYREDSFFILSCRGNINYELLQGQSSLEVIGESIGVNHAAAAWSQNVHARSDTVDKMAQRLRHNLSLI